MKLSKFFSLGAVLCLAAVPTLALAGNGKVKPKVNQHSQLHIQRDPVSGKVILSWKGRGMLKKAARWNDDFKTVYEGTGDYVVDATEETALFKLDGSIYENGLSNVYSLNVVGYVNVILPPGLSLIANPLYQTNFTVSAMSSWGWNGFPDGSQVFKYSQGSSYEVSTYDGIAKTWSDPGLDVNIGTGFFFNNPSSISLTQTFVGAVLEGQLVNPLPSGLSTKGSLVPQAGSINDLHGIPGEDGDELRTYENDFNGGGSYNVSVFYSDTQRWEPDLILAVAEGFWIKKQNAQDWVRNFTVPN